MTSQPLRTRPIGQPLRGSPVLSGEGETFVVRSYFVSSWIYELTGARHALRRIRTHVETRSAPELESLGHPQPFQELVGTFDHRMRPPLPDRVALAEVAPAGGHPRHAGSARRHHVA